MSAAGRPDNHRHILDSPSTGATQASGRKIAHRPLAAGRGCIQAAVCLPILQQRKQKVYVDGAVAAPLDWQTLHATSPETSKVE
eukprot:scaffold317509_cov33-Tisochrysis_lutea.AAC.1